MSERFNSHCFDFIAEYTGSFAFAAVCTSSGRNNRFLTPKMLTRLTIGIRMSNSAYFTFSYGYGLFFVFQNTNLKVVCGMHVIIIKHCK